LRFRLIETVLIRCVLLFEVDRQRKHPFAEAEVVRDLVVDRELLRNTDMTAGFFG
jgi:hypothetical protein